MTEEEAKQRWCPMKKFTYREPVTFTGTPEETAPFFGIYIDDSPR